MLMRVITVALESPLPPLEGDLSAQLEPCALCQTQAKVLSLYPQPMKMLWKLTDNINIEDYEGKRLNKAFNTKYCMIFTIILNGLTFKSVNLFLLLCVQFNIKHKNK